MAQESSGSLSKMKWVAGSILIIAAISVATVLVMRDRTESKNEDQVAVHRHETPGETCYLCDPSLRDKGRLWCKEHNRYEDRCWACQPQLQDKNRAYCKEHFLYEDECFICNPSLKPVDSPDGKGSSETGQAPSTERCKVHGIDKSQCFICDPSLREQGRLWCKEHNCYEDRCWECHPELQDGNRPFCKEHDLYEDECIFCNPALKKKADDETGDNSSTRPTLFCKEHNVPEKECGICQPQRASTLKPGQSMKVRFVSNLSIFKAGIQTARPTVISSSPSVEAFCRVGYNENAFAHITPLASGVIRRVMVDVGENVNKGDVLLEINSAEIAEAKAGYLAAIADHRVKEIACKREEKLVEERISATREYEEAKANCDIALLAQNTARQKLLNYGFSEEEIAEIKKTQDSSSLYMVRAPFSGTVVARKAVLGEAAEPGQALFALADLATVWLDLSIPAEQVAFVKKGLDVEAAFNSLPGISVTGTLTWVDSSIDERSRMLKARAVVSNERGVLKSGMFGQAKVTIEGMANHLRVPKGAVQRLEGNPYLFVKEEEDLYSLRRVLLGNKADSGIDVIDGIRENEQVVVTGTFTVMSEFLKSRLGAGCVDD